MTDPKSTVQRARSLRKTMSLPEVLVWQRLRGRQCAGLRFRRQHPIGPFVLDFYCASARLAVEIDGAVHDSPEQAAYDAHRTRWLMDNQISCLRFPAATILAEGGLDGLLATIEASCPSTVLRTVPLPGEAGEDRQ